MYLSKIKYILDTDLDANDSMELYFVEEVYDNLGQLIKTVELIPNGAKTRVTNATKNQVIRISFEAISVLLWRKILLVLGCIGTATVMQQCS